MSFDEIQSRILKQKAIRTPLELAAPDLLRELNHLVCLMESIEAEGGLDIPGLATLNGARAAIAKAESEATKPE